MNRGEEYPSRNVPIKRMRANLPAGQAYPNAQYKQHTNQSPHQKHTQTLAEALV